MDGWGEPGEENAFQTCDHWDYDIEFITEKDELEIIVTNRNDQEFVFSNKFRPDDLRRMGLNCKDSVLKVEKLLTQARNGESDESHLYYLLRGSSENDIVEGPIVYTLGDVVKTLVLRLEWNSLIGDYNFQFPLQRILPNSESYLARENKQLKDRVQHLEYEVKLLKDDLALTRSELSRLTKIVENIQSPQSLDNESIVFNGREEDRYSRLERKRRNKKYHRRRGAVQLDRAPSEDFGNGEFNFSSFSEYENYRRVDSQNRRGKNHSWNSLPPSFYI